MRQRRGARGGGSWLDGIERIGNTLPDPTTLFLIGALLVVLLSQLAANLDWTVEKTVTREVVSAVSGETSRELVRVPVKAVGLLNAEGAYWMLRSMVSNFVSFPPLGIVLVGMLGIGLAEKSGLIGALLKGVMFAVPSRLLTPAVFFVGVMSSMGLVVAVAALDELRQSFLATRTGSLGDVAINFTGGALGVGLIVVLHRWLGSGAPEKDP